MKLLAAATLALVLTAVVVAADASGTWNVEGEVVGNAVKFTCVLKQEGATLSGTATLADSNKPLPVKGSVKDKVVTFQFDVEWQGTTYTDVFTGPLGDNGVINGKIEVAGVEGTFTAKKQQ
jgi:hypothetical protein